MATVFAGERLLNVQQLNDDSIGELSAYTYYTVPAGRWAKVKVHRVEFTNTDHAGNLLFGLIPFGDQTIMEGNNLNGASSFFASSGFKYEGGATTDTVGGGGEVEFIMSTGQTIQDSTASGTAGIEIWVTIQEFANP